MKWNENTLHSLRRKTVNSALCPLIGLQVFSIAVTTGGWHMWHTEWMTREEIDSKGDVVGRFTEAGKTYSDYTLEKDLPDILAQ